MGKVIPILLGIVLLAQAISCQNHQSVISPHDRIKEALFEIETPSDPVNRGYLRFDIGKERQVIYRSCFRADDYIEFLIKTNIDVSPALLQLAQPQKNLEVRYRATYILAMRGNKDVIPILEKMCTSNDPLERQLAWNTYRIAIDNKKISPPENLSAIIDLYKNEKDNEARMELEQFLGIVKAKDALPLLVKEMLANPDVARSSVWAIGEIGDPETVPALISVLKQTEHNESYPLQALGKIGTPEAVEFLINNIDKYGCNAIEALYESKSKRALPEIKKYLERIKDTDANADLNRAVSRVTIIRLSEKDPRQSLLNIFSDENEPYEVRSEAITTLRQQYDTAPIEKQILDIYIKSENPNILLDCLYILEDSRLEGVTNAIIKHAKSFDEANDIGKNDIAWNLRHSLSKRLDKKFNTIEELKTYLIQSEKQDKQKD